MLGCLRCDTHWYVGLDTEDDIYYLHRLKKEEKDLAVLDTLGEE
jgi:hypothetical protein